MRKTIIPILNRKREKQVTNAILLESSLILNEISELMRRSLIHDLSQQNEEHKIDKDEEALRNYFGAQKKENKDI